MFDNYSACSAQVRPRHRYTQTHIEPLKREQEQSEDPQPYVFEKNLAAWHSSWLQEFHIPMSKITSFWYMPGHKNIASCSEVCV